MSHQLNHILLTIDVEDWFQVENFKQCIPSSSWPSFELRVEKNTHRLLDLLDSVSSTNSQQATTNEFITQSYRMSTGNVPETERNSFRRRRIGLSQFHQETEKREKSIESSKSCLTTANSTNSPKATFFVLGWIAERLPHLVREIHRRGHEVASHGYYHNLCDQISPEDLERDLIDSKKLLEDIIGSSIYGYRAPSFSINEDILKVIEDCGYLYDSSYNSFAMHGRYGHLDLSQNGTRGIALQIPRTKHQEPLPREIHDSDSEACFTGAESKIFYELPISNINPGNSILPWGGGGYFRLTPFPLFKIGVEFILRQENAYLFYLHPWEIDPEQPKVKEVSKFFKFRHYINLNKTASKLSSFIEAFNQCHFATCHQYLKLVPRTPQ
jgi:polysaccharide deacetylase family protein (PEP-CTERM system associated)